jgi:hypothetical protein
MEAIPPKVRHTCSDKKSLTGSFPVAPVLDAVKDVYVPISLQAMIRIISGFSVAIITIATMTIPCDSPER